MLGYYSYKVVVKQQEQEYYNVYLPGIVNGEINTSSPGSSSNKAVLSLFADNVNKVPKDLRTVGPSQTNYSSEAILSIRVNNEIENNIQYYPGSNIEKVTQISELSDLGVNLIRHQQEVDSPPGTGTTYNLTKFDEDKVFPGSSVVVTESATGNVVVPLSDSVYVVNYYAGSAGAAAIVELSKDLSAAPISYTVQAGDTFTFGPAGVIFNGQNNPLIGILKTSNELGVSEDNGFEPLLAVAETKPTFSNLNLFWETSMNGSILDLNLAVVNDEADINPIGFSVIDVDFSESDIPIVDTPVSNDFGLLLPGNILYNGNGIDSMELLQVRDGSGTLIPNTGGFKINEVSTGLYNIVWKSLPNNDHKYYCGADPAKSTLSFFLRAVLTNGLVFTTEHRMQINNAPPEILSSTYPDGSINPNIAFIRYKKGGLDSTNTGGSSGDGTIFGFGGGFAIGNILPAEPGLIYGGLITVGNGSSSPSQRHKEVTCEIEEALVTSIEAPNPCTSVTVTQFIGGNEVTTTVDVPCGDLNAPYPGLQPFDPTGDALSGNLSIGQDLGPNASLVPSSSGSATADSEKWRVFNIAPLNYSSQYAATAGVPAGLQPGSFMLTYKGLPQDDCYTLSTQLQQYISTIDICCNISVRFNLNITDGTGETYPLVDSFWEQDNITNF